MRSSVLFMYCSFVTIYPLLLCRWATPRHATPPGRSATAFMGPALSPLLMILWKTARSTTTTTIQKLTSGTRGVRWTPSTSGRLSPQVASCLRSPRMCRTQMEPWSSTLCSSSVSTGSVFYRKPCWRCQRIVQMCNWVQYVSSYSSLGWEIPWQNGGHTWFPGYPLIHHCRSHDASYRWIPPSSLLLTVSHYGWRTDSANKNASKIRFVCSFCRSVRLLRGRREPYLCPEHASGPEAGLYDPYHALSPGAPGASGETPDQAAGGHLDQQDGEQGCGHFPPQSLTGRQPQPAGKWWPFDGLMVPTI